MAGELSFVELGVEDAERGRAFYEELFGWKFEPGPSGNGFMIMAPNVSGGIHGGDARATPYVFFAVDWRLGPALIAACTPTASGTPTPQSWRGSAPRST